MQHHAHAHAGADVGGAGGEVAQRRGRRRAPSARSGRRSRRSVPRRPAGRGRCACTWIRRWSSSLIIRLNSRRPSMATPRAPCSRLLAADQLPLDEELPVDALEVFDVDVFQTLARPGRWQSARAETARSGRDPARVARLMNGKSARLRASRMRLLMTMSDSGPVPLSHSPLRGCRSFDVHQVVSSLGFHAVPAAKPAFLDPADFVAHLARPFSYSSSSIGFLHLRRRRISWSVRRWLPAATGRRGRAVVRCAGSPRGC